MAESTSAAVSVAELNRFLVDRLPFCVEMNISCVHVEPDKAVARFSYDERWIRPGGIVCGPVLMTLADVGAYFAIFSRVGVVPLAVTNELKTNFLRPAIGHDVEAEARLVKLGRRVAYASVDVYEPHDRERLVAHATTSYVLPSE